MLLPLMIIKISGPVICYKMYIILIWQLCLKTKTHKYRACIWHLRYISPLILLQCPVMALAMLSPQTVILKIVFFAAL